MNPHDETDSIATQTLQIDTLDGPMPCYEATPEDEPRGSVVVIQEAFGVNHHIEDVCRRLAREGYRAVAPHLYHRSGTTAFEYGDFSTVRPAFDALTDADQLTDVDATLEYLRESTDCERIGIVGFCMGGRTSFMVGAVRSLGAAVTYYGGGIVTERAPGRPSLMHLVPTIKTPWLGLFGQEDQSIPPEELDQLRWATAAAPVETDMVVYPGAGHAFNSDPRPSYHEPSAKDAWSRTLDWFARHIATS